MSRSPFLAALLGLALLSPATRAAEAPAPAVETLKLMEVRGNVVIGLDGAVVSADITTAQMPAPLRESLLAIVRGWRFEPIRLRGVPTQAQTGFKMVLAARQDGDNYKVRVDGVDFGDAKDKAALVPDGVKAPIVGKLLTPPNYPQDLMMRGLSGGVMVAVLVGANGRTERAQVVQSLAHDFGRSRSNNAALRTMHALESSALAAVKNWTFDISPERAAAPPKERTVIVPIIFMVDYDVSQPGYWVPVRRGARRPVEWMPPESSEGLALGASSSGAPMDIDSPFKMLSPASGTALN